MSDTFLVATKGKNMTMRMRPLPEATLNYHFIFVVMDRFSR